MLNLELMCRLGKEGAKADTVIAIIERVDIVEAKGKTVRSRETI
jgi:hypothetical protein